MFSSQTALKRFYCKNLRPKYLAIQSNLPVTCLDQTRVVKNEVCIIPADDSEGTIDSSCRSILGLCYAQCLSTATPTNFARPVQLVSKTVVQKVTEIANNTSAEMKQAVSQITDVAIDHFANLSIEAIKAIIGVCISATILTLTTVGTWCARKVLKQRFAQRVQSENVPMHQSFENPSSVVHVQPEETEPLPVVGRSSSASNFEGPVILENELYHSPVNH